MKYFIILHCAGANVSRTSNLCGSDVAIGYWALYIQVCLTSRAMILMLNFIDIWILFHKLLGGQHIPDQVINRF
jgi:hypothetical protein